MGLVFAFFTSKIAGPLFAVIALGLGVTTALFYVQRNVYDDEINNPKTGYVVKLQVANDNLDKYKTAFNACNASVTNYSDMAKAATAHANALLALLRDQGKKTNAEVAALLKSRPKPGQDVCKAAFDLGRSP